MIKHIFSELNIVQWNARSIMPKIHELKTFLIQHNIDIALISETFLKPHIFLNIHNYTVHRNDNIESRGLGTAVIIRKTIKHTLIPHVLLKNGEATAINAKGDIAVVSIYIQCDRLRTEDLDTLLSIGNKTIIAGDFNVQHPTWKCVNSYTLSRRT